MFTGTTCISLPFFLRLVYHYYRFYRDNLYIIPIKIENEIKIL